jgi:hypothetical protein
VSDNIGDVEVGGKGVVFKGAYEDLRPIVRRSVAIGDTVLSAIENVVGLPADFLNHHLGAFRKRYQERLNQIPDENRDLPPFRVGCAVLKQVAFAAEEPDLQEMFADLLGTSSSTETKHFAHPGFADVISQLLPLDARILRAFSKKSSFKSNGVTLWALRHHFSSDNDQESINTLDVSLINLIRLGLLEWDSKGISGNDLLRLKSGRRGSITLGFGPSLTENTIRNLNKSLESAHDKIQENSDAVSKLLDNFGAKLALNMTAFGYQFVAACLPNQSSESRGGHSDEAT